MIYKNPPGGPPTPQEFLDQQETKNTINPIPYEVPDIVEDGEDGIIVQPAKHKEIKFKKPSNQRGPNRGTMNKIAKVRKRRRELIDRHIPIPGFYDTCDYCEISAKTVKRNDPELFENWDNYDYDIED